MGKLMEAAQALNNSLVAGPYSGQLQQLAQAANSDGLLSGSENKPKTSDQNYDANENAIHHTAGVIANASRSYFEKRIRVQESQLDQLETSSNDNSTSGRIMALLPKAQTELHQIFSRDSAKLIHLKKSSLEHESALNYFKSKHKLNRPASFPESSLLQYLKMGIAGLGEAIFGTLFYADFTGIATAIFLALLVSMLNTMWSALCGSQWRNKNHLDSKLKALGWISFATWLTTVFYLNKLISMFRAELSELKMSASGIGDSLSHAGPGAFHRTFEVLPNAGFSILDLQGWLLLGVGFSVSAFAFYEGYVADDVFPGYGAAARQFKVAEGEYRAEENALRELASNTIRSVQAELDAVERERNLEIKKFNEMAVLFSKTQQDYHNDMKSLEADLRFAVKNYRDANSSVSVTPRPAYFLVEPHLSVAQISISERWEPGALANARNKIERAVTDLTAICAEERNKLVIINRENGSQVDKFFRGIEQSAKDEIGGLKIAEERAS